MNLNAQSELYGHAVHFYVQPPLENISLNEFETFAVERLKCETLDLFCLSEKNTDFHFKLMCKTFDKVSTPYFASLWYFHTSYI